MCVNVNERWHLEHSVMPAIIIRSVVGKILFANILCPVLLNLHKQPSSSSLSSSSSSSSLSLSSSAVASCVFFCQSGSHWVGGLIIRKELSYCVAIGRQDVIVVMMVRQWWWQWWRKWNWYIFQSLLKVKGAFYGCHYKSLGSSDDNSEQMNICIKQNYPGSFL